MEDLILAKRTLLDSDDTVVVVKDGQVLARGQGKTVRPLLAIIQEQGLQLQGAVLADRVVGRAAAFLAVYAGIKAVYAELLSEGAKAILAQHGITVQWTKLTPAIQNRRKDDLCPMEKLVRDISDVTAAYNLIVNFVKRVQPPQ